MSQHKSKLESCDAFAQQLLNAIPPAVRHLPHALQKQFHELLHATLIKMDLVTREEFDAQVRVLQRTREKLEALEKHLAQYNSSTSKK